MVYSLAERLRAVHKRTRMGLRLIRNKKLRNEEITERTNTTIKMANVSQESAETASEQLTSIWNNFYNGSKSLEYYADVMVALGASTASSSDEIAAGISS